MAESTGREGGKRVLGFPLQGFGLLQSLLLAVASGFLSFFTVTTVAIFALLGWNLVGGHAVNYADAYRRAGFPAGVVVLAVALVYLLAVWLRAKAKA
jgi:hypothetical protein